MRPTPLKILFSYLSHHVECNELVHGAAIDSRLVKAGDLFFAIKGKKFDPHEKLEEVASKYAIGAVVDQSYQGPSYGLTLIHVEDVKQTLHDLAKAYLSRREVKVVAITGSLGKTTTKEFAKTFIGSSYKLFASPLSYNSQVTVPVSILSSRGDEEIMMLEMGMSEPGNLNKLIEIAPPDYALITTIAIQHANHFEKGLEGIAREKTTLFKHPNTKLGLYLDEMPYADLAQMVGSCGKKTFSLKNPDADFYLAREGDHVTVHEKGAPCFSFPLKLPMRVYDLNFLAAYSLARTLGVDAALLCELVPLLKTPPMRYEKIEKEGVTFVNDAFNANPDAMLAAFDSLPQPKKGGRRIGIISEMDALGQYTKEGHEQVGKAAIDQLDHLFCIGPHCSFIQDIWKKQNKECLLFSSVEEIKQHLSSFAKPGDVVLIKGARGYALNKIINIDY